MARARSLGLALTLAVGALCAAPAARSDPAGTRVVKGPYVTAFTDTTADIRFELDAPGPATVEITREHSGDPPRKILDAAPGPLHLVHVTGLVPAKSFVYGVSIQGHGAARGSFTTAPADTASAVRFAVYGDTRSDANAHAAVVRALGASQADFLINTGDVVGEGSSADDWTSFFTIEAPLLRTKALFMAIGNHELTTDEDGASFSRYFGFPAASGPAKVYGTARVGSARFFFLNSTHDWDSGEERQWLEQALTAADHETGILWRIAIAHHGPWCSGPHGPNQRLLSAHIPELLAAHHVDLLLAGHDHLYERGDAGLLKYVVSGGGGAPLYRPASTLLPSTRKVESTYHYVDFTLTPADLRLVAHRIDGSILDRCGFVTGKPWDCDPTNTAADTPRPAPLPLAPVPSSAPAPGPAPTPAPASPSRCSIEVAGAAGAAPAGVPLAGLLLGLGGVAVARRRRGCSRGR